MALPRWCSECGWLSGSIGIFLGRVKVCGGEGCGWMFLDESRNASRKWCESRDCGNRERVRQYLARKKRTSDS